MSSADLDPLAMLVALGVPAPTSATPVSGGWDTSLWQVRSGRQDYALRVFRAEQAETCRREALVMRALAELGFPVPRVHAEGVAQGRPALLLSWCPGRTLFQEVRARPWRLRQLGLEMGRAHARMHAQPVSDALRQALPAWLPRPEDASPELHEQLRATIDPGSISFLHLDFHPLNVMSDGRLVTGVLDWANVAIGDRRADLARTVTLFRLPPLPPGTPAVLRFLRVLLESSWRSGYRAQRTGDPFANLEPFYAWAGAMMERDLRPKLGRPGVWLREHDLIRIRRWTVGWQSRIASRARP